MNEDFEAQAKAWRDERITKIKDHVTPVPLDSKGRYLALHIMPSHNIDFNNQAEELRSCFQAHDRSVSASNNFDGVILKKSLGENVKPSYTQFFRAGGVEYIYPLPTYKISKSNDKLEPQPIDTININDCIKELRTKILEYIHSVYYCTKSENSSYFVSLGFLNVKSHSATLKNGEGDMSSLHTANIPYPNLQFKEIIIDKMPELLLIETIKATPEDRNNYTEALLPIIKHMVAVTGASTKNKDIDFLFEIKRL